MSKITLLTITMAGSLAWATAGQSDQPVTAQPRPEIRASADSTGDPVDSFQLPAIVRPALYVELPALAAGAIQEVLVREGQFVSKGDVLIQMDDRVARARVEAARVRTQLQGALQRANVERRIATERLQRLQKVVGSGAGRTYELQEAQGAIDQASASIQQQQDELAAARAELQLAEAQLTQQKVVAPFNGLVTQILRKAGAVDPSILLIEMADLDQLEAEMNLPAATYGQLRIGQTVQLQAGVPVSRKMTGKIHSISPIIDSGSDTYRCVVQIDNSDRKLPAGFRVILAE